MPGIYSESRAKSISHGPKLLGREALLLPPIASMSGSDSRAYLTSEIPGASWQPDVLQWQELHRIRSKSADPQFALRSNGSARCGLVSPFKFESQARQPPARAMRMWYHVWDLVG